MNTTSKLVLFLVVMNCIQMHAGSEYLESGLKNSSDRYTVSTDSPTYTSELHFSALILQPYSNLDYAAAAFLSPTFAPNWALYSINPAHRFGFEIGYRAVFHDTDTNLTLNFEHFKDCSCARQYVANENMIAPLFAVGSDSAAYVDARSAVKFNFDKFTADFGQFVQVGDHLFTNWFGGISFARIKQNLVSTFSDNNGSCRTIEVPSRFIGAGPEFGVDYTYGVSRDFYFSGKTAVSILAGTLKNHTNYSSVAEFVVDGGSPAVSLGTATPNKQHACVQCRSVVVPGFVEQIGFGFEHIFCDESVIRLELGYMAEVYLNAIQTVDMSSEDVGTLPAPATAGVFARTFQKNDSNFALTGPYVKFDVGF